MGCKHKISPFWAWQTVFTVTSIPPWLCGINQVNLKYILKTIESTPLMCTIGVADDNLLPVLYTWFQSGKKCKHSPCVPTDFILTCELRKCFLRMRLDTEGTAINTGRTIWICNSRNHIYLSSPVWHSYECMWKKSIMSWIPKSSTIDQRESMDVKNHCLAPLSNKLYWSVFNSRFVVSEMSSIYSVICQNGLRKCRNAIEPISYFFSCDILSKLHFHCMFWLPQNIYHVIIG